MLGYFFHPLYKGKGLKTGIFHQICHWSIKLLINNVGDGKNSANHLVGQMSDYKNYKRLYEFEYIPGSTFSVNSWWRMIEQYENWIQKIALIVNSNVGCERVFSVLGWICSKRHSKLLIDRMNSLAKLHSYY